MFHRFQCLAGSLVVLSLFQGTVNAEELRWKFQKGDVWNVTLQAETSSTSTLNTKILKSKQETRLETKWTIDDVQDGVARITQEVVRLSLTSSGVDGGGVAYDSAATEKPVGPAKEIATAVAPFLGAKIRCRMNGRGQISDVVADEVVGQALEAEKAEAADDGWGWELLKQPLCLLPEKEVAAGGTWLQERKFNLPRGAFKQQQTFKLVEVDQDRAKISVEAVLTPEDVSKKTGIRDQEQTGELTFDLAVGRLVRSTVNQKLTLASPFRDKEIVVKTLSVRRVEVTPGK